MIVFAIPIIAGLIALFVAFLLLRMIVGAGGFLVRHVPILMLFAVIVGAVLLASR